MTATHSPDQCPHIHVQAARLKPGLRLLCADGDYHTVEKVIWKERALGNDTDVTVVLRDWPELTVHAQTMLTVSNFKEDSQ